MYIKLKETKPSKLQIQINKIYTYFQQALDALFDLFVIIKVYKKTLNKSYFNHLQKSPHTHSTRE